MLCECLVDRLSTHSLMADEVERGFCNAGYILLLVWPIY